MRFALTLLLCFSLRLFSADIIPSDRRITWQGNVGIPGGIVTPSTIYTNMNSIDATGATDVQAAIQGALSSCPTGQVVKLPAGTFQIASTLVITKGVLRGSGTNTIISMNFSVSSSAGGLRISAALGGDTTWGIATTSAVKGTNSLVLSNTTGLAVGNNVGIEQDNDNSLVSNGSTEGAAGGQDLWFGTTRNMMQYFEVTAINGNTITINPPLNYTWTNSLNMQLHRKGSGGFVENCGIEDLVIVQTTANGEKNLTIECAKRCWIKNVESRNCFKYHCQLQEAFQCEVRDSYFHDAQGSTSGGNYGVSVAFGTAFSLIENNIINNCITSMLLTEMAQGNVFAYNYSPHVQYSPSTFLQTDMTSHDCHPMMNLMEGNVIHMMAGDYVHGSSSHNTLFRNNILGSQSGTTAQNRGVMLDEFNQYYNIIGNVIGSTNVTTSYEAVGPGSAADTSAVIYQLGYGAISSGNYLFVTTNVANTTLRLGNYVTYTGFSGIPASESIGATNLDDSLYLNGKPSWWGTNRWPAMQPAASVQIARIPAQNTFDGIDNGVGLDVNVLKSTRQGKIEISGKVVFQ